jgi:hypothetical protein
VGKDEDLQRRVLLRAALATFHYNLPSSTLLLALTPAAVVPERFTFAYYHDEPVDHRIEVRRIYEESADSALLKAPPALLPLCPAMQPGDGDRKGLLEQTLLQIAQLQELTPERRRLLMQWASTWARFPVMGSSGE